MTTDPLRVLVVDDDEDFRELLSIQLGLVDELEVVGRAADGRQALDFVADHGVDAVVMDLLMPRMNGFEAIEHLQRDHPEVGLVAYTAVAGTYAREQTARLGVELALKSGQQTTLVAALHRSVERAAGRAS